MPERKSKAVDTGGIPNWDRVDKLARAPVDPSGLYVIMSQVKGD